MRSAYPAYHCVGSKDTSESETSHTHGRITTPSDCQVHGSKQIIHVLPPSAGAYGSQGLALGSSGVDRDCCQCAHVDGDSAVNVGTTWIGRVPSSPNRKGAFDHALVEERQRPQYARNIGGTCGPYDTGGLELSFLVCVVGLG